MSSPSTSTPRPDPARLARFAAGAAIVFLTSIAYLPVLSNGFIWDDDDYITNNPNLATLEGLGRIWFEPSSSPQYYPLVHTTFWIEHHLWGLDPRGYHAVNVALHILSALLLWRLLERLGVGAGADARPKHDDVNRSPHLAAITPAWLIAAAFALHPVCVESVAWATERKNVLMFVFYLLAAGAYVRFEGLEEPDSPEASARPPFRPRWYALALLFFVAAMLSKTVACSLGVGLLILIFWKRGRVSLASAWPVLPFLAIGLALGLTTAWLEKHHVRADGPEWSLTFAQRTLIAGRALWFYGTKIIWPTDLCFIYERWSIDPRDLGAWLFPLAAAVLPVALLLLRRRIGRGPFAAVAFFGVTLFPALGFINIYPMRFTFVADHYQYVACVGLISLTLLATRTGLRRLGPGVARAGPALAAAMLLALACLTHLQAYIYRGHETLWPAVIRLNPRAAIAYSNLGVICLNQGNDAEAERFFLDAIAVNPRHYEAQNNLASLRYKKGDVDGAIACLRLAIDANPDFAFAHNNLGLMLVNLGKIDEAELEFRRAVAAEPKMLDAWHNLGAARAQRNDPDGAIEAFTRCVEIDPRDAEAMANLARLNRAKGRGREAEQWLQRALQVTPGDEALRQELQTLQADMNRAPAGPAAPPSP